LVFVFNFFSQKYTYAKLILDKIDFQINHDLLLAAFIYPKRKFTIRFSLDFSTKCESFGVTSS